MNVLHVLMTTILLASCGQQAAKPDSGQGRYGGIGTYPAGERWPFIKDAKSSNEAAATRGDDDQIVVTIDRETGEVRQCGNLSGRCVVSNPWRDSVAVQLDRESLAAAAKVNETVVRQTGGR